MSSQVLFLETDAPSQCADFEGLKTWIGARSFQVSFLLLKPDWEQVPADNQTRLVVMHAGNTAAARQAREALVRRFPRAARMVFCCASGAQGSPDNFARCGSPEAVEQLRRQLTETAEPVQAIPGVIGWAPALRKAIAQVGPIADSDATCLLQGETGTGKELFARAIHYLGPRRPRPFVPVNCGAIPDQLFENEVFGHARGAYTDARSEERGLLAYAEDGTLFLDEIDALSQAAQVKLLRVLQEREYRPVGSAKSLRTGVRVIAATNTDLRVKVKLKQFREDLFHRLNILRLSVPSLRERPEDIPMLVRHLLRQLAARYRRPAPLVNEAALDSLMQYTWPGNVRELEGVLERAVLLARGGEVTADDLDLPEALPADPRPAGTLREAKDRAIAHFERTYLAEVLARCQGNISRAARIAGKERRTFQRLLRKHNISAASAHA